MHQLRIRRRPRGSGQLPSSAYGRSGGCPENSGDMLKCVLRESREEFFLIQGKSTPPRSRWGWCWCCNPPLRSSSWRCTENARDGSFCGSIEAQIQAQILLSACLMGGLGLREMTAAPQAPGDQRILRKCAFLRTITRCSASSQYSLSRPS